MKSEWRECVRKYFHPVDVRLGPVNSQCLGALNLKVGLLPFNSELGALENNNSFFVASI